MKFIYQPGQLYAQTSTSIREDGIEYADFSGEIIYGSYGNIIEKRPDKVASDYLRELNEKRAKDSPEFIICEYEDMKVIKDKAENEKFIKPWVEITEERWDDMLNCLPPEKWQTVDGVNIFRMCEYYTSNITTHFARVGNKYFESMRRTTCDYKDLAREIYEAAK